MSELRRKEIELAALRFSYNRANKPIKKLQFWIQGYIVFRKIQRMKKKNRLPRYIV